VPVDLNSLLFGLEEAIRAGCQAAAQAACVREFSQRAAARRAAIDHYLWDRDHGAYLDYRWARGERRAELSAATLYPLFTGLASPQQATAVAATVRRQLLEPGGLVTTPRATGQQWDAPNGWAPLQWIAIAGLRAYGEQPLAQTIACRWMANVEGVYQVSGKLVEKYDVMASGGGGGGEYPLQDGFGWTNGVLRKLLVLYPAYESLSGASGCAALPGERNSAPAGERGD
jgi:alpha,alpha-trehalase